MEKANRDKFTKREKLIYAKSWMIVAKKKNKDENISGKSYSNFYGRIITKKIAIYLGVKELNNGINPLSRL